ncbi:uncharacterized protein LOC142097328 [Mixophyes fleayi]|uniref:uncharacterized protein LOC142097328 n=1 Tax=Mixophyes fleayi TaxID=3061075 RepID=UPI003F4E175F
MAAILGSSIKCMLHRQLCKLCLLYFIPFYIDVLPPAAAAVHKDASWESWIELVFSVQQCSVMAQASESSREIITEYVPGCSLRNIDHGIQRVLLQVFGRLGHGKSSLINSCLCVVKDVGYENLAESGIKERGMTMARKDYELTNKLVIIDNRGLNKLNAEEILESNAQFRSLRSLGEVTWTGKTLSEPLRLFMEQRKSRPVDFMVPVFVYSCTCTDEWNETIKVLKETHRITGINPIIVITKQFSGDYEKIMQKFRDFGSTRIVSLENYTKENQTRTPEADGRILDFLKICIEEAEPGIGRMVEQDPTTRLNDQMIKQVEQETEMLRKKQEELKRNVKKAN